MEGDAVRGTRSGPQRGGSVDVRVETGGALRGGERLQESGEDLEMGVWDAGDFV